MKTAFFFFASLSLLFLVSCQQETECRLYYLGGQSNMVGFGSVPELPPELNQPVEGVYIFHGNEGKDLGEPDGRGLWEILAPGHGNGFRSDGDSNLLSNRFGLELSFARRMQELFPGEKIALVKYARGGTAIDTAAQANAGCWEPDFRSGNGINQYDHFLSCLNAALAVEDIDGDGRKDRLIPSGILWMQGETDAKRETSAQHYEQNLARLMQLIRQAMGRESIPVAIGRISDSGQADDGKVWDYCEVVREAQARYTGSDRNAVLVTSTDHYGYSDPYHYDTEGYLDLGRQFAEALYRLRGSDSD